MHIAVSEQQKREYAQYTGEPIYVVPNGCDAKAVLGLTERVSSLRLEKASLVLLQPTRFVRRKNIEMGLRVLAELPDAIYLVTAAPDPHQKDGIQYFRELKRLSRELDVTKRVHFLGEKVVRTARWRRWTLIFSNSMLRQKNSPAKSARIQRFRHVSCDAR
jgi:glycosyltransferase involved in cell wall biosynthesis